MKEWLRSREKAFYRIVNAVLLICMVLFGGEHAPGVGIRNAVHLMAALAVLGILAGIHYIPVRGRILCLTILFILLCAGLAAGPAGSPAFWGSFFLWLVGKGTVFQEWEMAFELLQTVLFAAVCYLIQIIFEKLPLLKSGAAALLSGLLVFCLLTRRELNHPGMAFALCFLLMSWQEWVQRHWKKKRVKECSVQVHTFWILPFLALYLGLMMLAPAPEEPYDWMWAKEIYRQLQESFQTYTQRFRWGSREGFGMAFTGFSPEGALGGELQEDAREVMRVRVKPSEVGNLYLTGMVYDSFDGREWSLTWQEDNGGVFLDTAQSLYAVKNYDRRYQNDYLREIIVDIRYEDFNTGYVFAPLKTWDLEEDPDRRNPGGAGNYTCEAGTMRWNGQKGYGTEYGLRYFALNTGQSQFDLFLEEAGKTDTINEAVWEEIAKECGKRNGYLFSLSDAENYRQEVYEHYLGEIKLSGELENYLEKILEGAETDVEKLRAIESALSGYDYTLTPGELPEDVKDAEDFLDYFLLESRQGYCTYFATAFVLLARAEGIPARYVQGYCVPIGEQGEAGVYSYMAHAWPEAYLAGAGWIPFEPTPGYGSRRYDPWRLQQPGDVSAGEADLADGNDAGAAGGIGEADDLEGADGAEKAEEENREEESAPDYSWKLFCSAAVGILAVCLIMLVSDNLLGRYRYGKLGPEMRLRTEVLRNLKVLSCFGLEREAWETLEEFRERAGRLLEQCGEAKAVHTAGQYEDKKSRPLPLRFTEHYERVMYGGETAGERMIKEAVEEREELLRLLKQKRRWLWFYCRVRLYLGRYRV